jgi:hypothetical protein
MSRLQTLEQTADNNVETRGNLDHGAIYHVLAGLIPGMSGADFFHQRTLCHMQGRLRYYVLKRILEKNYE